MKQHLDDIGLHIYMERGEGISINGQRIYAIGKSTLYVLNRKSKATELKRVL